jgi:PKD domain
MSKSRICVVAVVTALVGLSVALPPGSAHAIPPTVVLHSSDADLEIFQYVDDQHQRDPDASFTDFISLAEHRHPATIKALEGTSSAFVNQATTLETPAQPPFPSTPLNDIAVTGRADAGATATGNGVAVPVTDNSGSFDVDFTIEGGDVPVFFSGAEQTSNGDKDSCSPATVELEGPGAFDRKFVAYSGGDCPAPKPHSNSWAETDTLATGEYEIFVSYEAEVSDDAQTEPASMSASSVLTLNLSFFPPSADFTTTVAGSTAHFNASRSNEGAADRKLTKYEWTFGDGTTKTTTTPMVTHTYPAGPTKPVKYPVTLRTVDSGGAVSPVATHDVAATTTSVKIAKGKALALSGFVAPNRHGKRMLITLLRRKGSHFHPVAKDRPKLNAHSRYVSTLKRGHGGKCQVVASYPGDRTHLASRAGAVFTC